MVALFKTLVSAFSIKIDILGVFIYHIILYFIIYIVSSTIRVSTLAFLPLLHIMKISALLSWIMYSMSTLSDSWKKIALICS
jgi:hypothetical protein